MGREENRGTVDSEEARGAAAHCVGHNDRGTEESEHGERGQSPGKGGLWKQTEKMRAPEDTEASFSIKPGQP